MTGLGRRMVALALLLGAGLVAASPGRANPAPAQSRLHVEWTVAAAGQGQSRVFGYVYVGGSKEYSAYQRLVTERRITQERTWAEQDAIDWALWSPWYWR